MKPKKAAKRPREADPVDSAMAFEKLLRKTSAGQHYTLLLYIAGTTNRSSQAVANIRMLCEEYLPGRYDLKVIDIYQNPGEAVEQQVIAAPTLIKQKPIPLKRMVGDLSDRDKILIGLNLANKETIWTTYEKSSPA